LEISDHADILCCRGYHRLAAAQKPSERFSKLAKH
jgi:hypothetical protein